MNNQLEELLGAYWDIAYQEGQSGGANGTQAQKALSAIRAVVEQARREEREACAQIAAKHEFGAIAAYAIHARNKKGGS